LFRKENLGVKYAISDAITWFFKYEREGIILEDDCVPVSNFFPFCEKLLDYYRNEKKVFAISGCNIKNNLKCDNESYHFSKYFHPWGWATWRRAWNHYDNEISFWPKWKKSRDWTLKMPIKAEQIIFKKIFDKEYFNQRENYDYRFMASILKNGGLIARHNLNLVNNIGWRLGTHNINEKDKHKYELVKKFKIELKHPKKVIQNKFKDSHLFFNLWDDKNLRMPRLLINLPIRLINYLLRKIS
jgi:hypothetical protein